METREREHALETLASLGHCPATSYHEKEVIDLVLARLSALGLSPQQDAYGNIIARYAPDLSLPAVAYVAHMDHPGFEIVEVQRAHLVARALGGVPPACFQQEVPLRILGPDGEARGTTQGRVGEEAQRQVAIRLTSGDPPALPAFAVLDLPDFSLDGDFIRMRALDDLAGCASILLALESMVEAQAPVHFYGLFTRAEEVGLVGARLAARQGLLPIQATVVSIESSRAIPGAVQGEGPVVRVGDASYTFDGAAEQLLLRAHRSLQEADPSFKAQRQLMSGGTCEATAFALQGYRATGLAYPLGNYHNATLQGGVAAEYIHVEDFQWGVELLVEAVRLSTHPAESEVVRRLAQVSAEDQQRLAESHQCWSAAG